MSILLELYTQLDAKAEELDDQIEECVCGIDPPMLSILGVGTSAKGVATAKSDIDLLVDSGLRGLAFFGLLEDVSAVNANLKL